MKPYLLPLLTARPMVSAEAADTLARWIIAGLLAWVLVMLLMAVARTMGGR